ncbi:MAG: hypothetical protein ACFCVE_05345 [Phycisphaerae bacterium]
MMLKRRTLALCLAALSAALLLPGCGGNTGPDATGQTTAQTTPGQPRLQPRVPAADPAQVGTLADTPDAAPAVPAGARYTIFLTRFTAPSHVRIAKQTKQNLIEGTGSSDFYIIHQGGQSELYFGYYRDIREAVDPAEAARAQRDKRRLEVMRDATGRRPFAKAFFVPLEQPDPAAPPEWNLLNAQGHWSLQIAAFRDHPDRKQAAVESVRQARAQGIEAYYFHGPSISSVMVGSWPESAVRGHTNEVDARVVNSERSIFVSTQQLPQGTRVRDERGREMAIFQPNHEIVDTGLLETMQLYGTHSLNGYEEIVNGKPRSPFLVQIPSRTDALTAETDLAVDPNQPELVDPQGMNRSNTTGLRSLD